MWPFPNQRILFPDQSEELFSKVGQRLQRLAAARLTTELHGLQPRETLSAEFVAWLISSTQKSKSSLRLACTQPQLLRALIADETEGRELPLVHLMQTLTHIERNQSPATARFCELTQWFDPLRKFSVHFTGRGEARVGQSSVDLFDDALSKESPFLRIHARQKHPEHLVSAFEVSERLTAHTYWRFGFEAIVLANPTDWLAPHQPIDSIGVLAKAELVALQEAVALLAKHLPHWSGKAADLIGAYHYTSKELPSERAPRVCYIQAHPNPVVVAERILRAEIDAQLRASTLVTPWVSQPLTPSELFSAPESESELSHLIDLAALARITAFHTALHAHAHPSVALTSMRERRERLTAELSDRCEAPSIEASLTGLGEPLLNEIRFYRQWSQSIAPTGRVRSHVAKPKRILLITLDFQDAIYSYLFQRAVDIQAHHRRHHVDVVRPHPTKAGTDVPCEMGLKQEYLTPGAGEQVLLESSDLNVAHAAIARLIAKNNYDAIVANIRVQTLYFLLEEAPKDLSAIPISLYDRHLHHDLDTYAVTPERIANLRRHRIFVNGLLDPAGADATKRAAAGFDMSRVYQWPWAVDESFFVRDQSRIKGRCPFPRTPTPRLRLFSGGNSGRDYKTLFEAVAGLPVEVRIATNLQFESVPENVTILGRIFLHEFRDEVRHSDLVVLPLGSRGGGGIGAVGITVVALAFALEKTVMCTDSTFINAYIEHGETGILVPPFQPDAMRTAIQELIDHKEYRCSLARNGKETALATEELAQVMLNQVDAVHGTYASPLPKRRPSIQAPVSIAILHMNPADSWDLQRLLEVQAAIREEKGLPCELIDLQEIHRESFPLPTGSNELPSLERQRQIFSRLEELGTNYVILDKCPSAYAYLKSCEVFGEELAPTVLLMDQQLLQQIEMMQENFAAHDAEATLGQWWPAPHIKLVSSYPSFRKLYQGAGLAPPDLRWLPVAAQQRFAPGPPPSQCDYVVADGVHMEDPRFIPTVLANLPVEYRQRVRYFGAKTDGAWEETGVQVEGQLPPDELDQVLRNARFIISPAKVNPSSLGGVSTADLARSAGRPLVTSDTPALREALGATNVLFCPPGDEKAMSEAITRCFEDDELVDGIYNEHRRFCEANSARHYADYLLHLAQGWQAPIDS
jgi:glycosyltransferase involved in cell wall biosynthesis